MFYVAVTRAKKHLYISSYESKGGLFFTQQSSFFSDMDTELLNCINNSKIGEKMQVYGIAFENVNGIRRLQFRADLKLL